MMNLATAIDIRLDPDATLLQHARGHRELCWD